SRGAFFRQQGKTLFLAFIRWPLEKNRLWLVRAETMLKRAREAGAADKDALLYLGLIQRLKGEHEKGFPFLEEAAASGSLRARIALGFSALENGHRKGATGHFTHVLQQIHLGDEPGMDSFQRFPSNPPLSAEQHYSLGRALEKRGHGFTPGFTRSSLTVPFYNAFEHYLLALKIDPNHLPSLKQAAELLAGFGAHTEAYSFMARAAEIAPQASELSERAEQLARLGYISIR
ncbi:MAG: hypothetical protein JRD68_16575, partial [Deltaproteobacteria bacterium]|nr:hypothetical protein [Deltaproteobacteria bacterium]